MVIRSDGLASILIAASFMGAVAVSSIRAETGSREEQREIHRGSLADFSFGFKAGVSFAQHTGTEARGSEYTVTSRWRTGVAAGIFLYVPVTSRFGIQQELMYIQKGSRQEIGVEILEIPTVLDVTYDMDYIEIPVLMKFAWLEREKTTLYSTAGTALSLKVRDRYLLTGEIDDGEQIVPLRADAGMSEVDMFDYSFIYGLGVETTLWKRRITIEHRFVIGWNTLSMPTYTYIPFGDERILIENAPVPLKNQAHLIIVGLAF